MIQFDHKFKMAMLGTRTLWRTSYGRPQHANVRTFFPEAKPKVSTPPPGPAVVSEVVEAAVPKVEKKARLHRRVLDHWKNFWLGIKTDYTEAVLDFKKDAQAKPVKSAILGAFAGFLLYCNQHNPDERSFHENFMDNGLELAQVRITYHSLNPSNSFLSNNRLGMKYEILAANASKIMWSRRTMLDCSGV